MDINLPMDPPVNNSLQGNLYDKLDAIAFEKTRVMNCQLDTRRFIQEKILNKYRQDVERIHENQTKRLRREFKKIQQKKPDYVYDDTDLAMSRSRGHESTLRQRSQSESESSVASKGGHCRRYYAHHFHVKYKKEDDGKNKEGKNKQREKTDFFNLKLKLFFYNTMKNIYETQKRMKESRENTILETTTNDINNDYENPADTKADAGELGEDFFGSPRHVETDNDESDKSPDCLQRSHNSFFSNRMAKVEETALYQAKPRRLRKRESRTLRMYGSDTVLNHIHKKRESLDEKAFAKKREQWLQTRQSSDKVFWALT